MCELQESEFSFCLVMDESFIVIVPQTAEAHIFTLLNNASLHKTNLTSSGTINPIWTSLYITHGILQRLSLLRAPVQMSN